MPSDLAEHAPRTGHPRLWVAGLVLVAVLTAVAFALLRDEGTTLTPPRAPEPSATSAPQSLDREAAATALLNDLGAALTAGTRADAASLAAPGERQARRTLDRIYDNVQEIGFQHLSLRYVDEAVGELTPAHQRDLDGRGWVADVEVEWRMDGSDAAVSRMETRFVLKDGEAEVRFVSAGEEYAERAPLWLLSRLAVERSRRTLVMVAGEKKVGRFDDQARRAVRAVKAVLPRWRGQLVVEVPRSERQLNRVVGAEPGTYTSIAALTSTADGSASETSAAHVFVNPRVFGRLGDQGAQIVISHEAAHVATDAAIASMPMWLLEGFADYVALADIDLPVSVTASQVLADVRRQGAPRSLPDERAFDPRDDHLGATYEAAWLACRYFAERFGERRLVELYTAVYDGMTTSEAFRKVVGVSQRDFVKGWRRYLVRLSS